MPVKDCYRKQDDAKSIVSGCGKINKNAAGVGALRRVDSEGKSFLKKVGDQNFGGVSGGV
ncbi:MULTISPECIES: hypothetical protein [Pseudomonadota]|uniref:hypothetical protein n=1 Tax=Pseudomonadota TaxID=1224 RepID=UPI000651A71F|nr:MULTISPECIES: hypothetical protein [Gammaproteobacteria]KMK82248.1 hypothetical protein KCO_17377 [Pectobacterium brasiliense ICMP 19477]MCL4779060.1 hypothetical protein [Gammaproteobacteria bacterium]NNA67655.1 hypothetical protein [Pseudomonas gessardii]